MFAPELDLQKRMYNYLEICILPKLNLTGKLILCTLSSLSRLLLTFRVYALGEIFVFYLLLISLNKA